MVMFLTKEISISLNIDSIARAWTVSKPITIKAIVPQCVQTSRK